MRKEEDEIGKVRGVKKYEGYGFRVRFIANSQSCSGRKVLREKAVRRRSVTVMTDCITE